MKKRIIILAAVILVVIAALSGAWYYAAGLIRSEIELLGFADGETSPQLTCASLDVRGFPFAFDVDCADAVIVTGDLMIEVPGVRASVMVYDFKRFLASARGPAQLSDAFTGQRWSLAWGKLDGSLRLVDSRIARLSLVGDNFVWSDLLLGDTLLASTPHAELHLLDMPEAHDAANQLSALALYARADALNLPMATLSDTAIELEAELTGVPDDYSTIGLTPILPTWQQAGGELNIVGLRMNDAAADLSATGKLSLDPQGLLNGSINIDSKGVAERIGPMIEEPWRTLVLGVPNAEGRHTNQLNFRSGALSSGLLPLTSLPSLF
jgi:hypothetical protein